MDSMLEERAKVVKKAVTDKSLHNFWGEGDKADG